MKQKILSLSLSSHSVHSLRVASFSLSFNFALLIKIRVRERRETLSLSPFLSSPYSLFVSHVVA